MNTWVEYFVDIHQQTLHMSFDFEILDDKNYTCMLYVIKIILYVGLALMWNPPQFTLIIRIFNGSSSLECK